MFTRFISFIKDNWGTILILSLFLFWGGFLRLYNLGEQSLWIDEGYTINASQGIIEHGYPILGSGETYPAHMAHNYITAGMMELFGFDPYNPWQARLPAAIFGILSILATFFFTKRITKNTLAAIAASFFMAFSYWEIAWSRQARGYIDMQFFIILSFAFFYNWLEHKKIIDGFLTILFLVFSYFSHGVALIFIPSFGLLFIIHSIWSGKIKEWLSPITIGFFILLGGFTIWIVTKVLPPIITYSYAERYTSFFTGDLKYVSLIALSIILGLFFWKKRFWRSMYIIGIILPTTIIIIFYSQVVQMRYLLVVFPFLLIAGSYGLYLIVAKKDYLQPIHRLIFYSIIIGIFASTMATFIPTEWYHLEVGSPQPDFKKGYMIIKNLQKEGDIIISPYTQLTKIYLGDRGLWLPISLTGRTSEIASNTINGGDYYTGAPIIPTIDALTNILNTEHGYIIIDSMARARLKGLFTTIIEHPRVIPVFYEESPTHDIIAVYAFGIGITDRVE